MPFLFSLGHSTLSRRGSGQRKETPKKQRQCRHLPRLGFPLWTPLSEAPPLQGMTKGGNPSPLRRERQICSRLRGPWGSGANRFVVCPLGHSLCSILFSLLPSARRGPRWPPAAGRCRPGGKGRGEALDFRARKIVGLKAKGLMIFPPPTLYLSFGVCDKAAYVSEHSSRFATPSAPRGSQ
jgi:hypothetical protein